MAMVNLLWLALVLGLVGCQSQSLYHWGGYEDAMYDYYKHPDRQDHFIRVLQQTIVEGERERNVPPSLYAELGFALLVRGDREQAIVYFQKEKNSWPESAYFMEIMIRNAHE